MIPDTHLRYITFIHLLISGNVEKAVFLTNQLLSVNPSHKRARRNLAYYKAGKNNENSKIVRSQKSSMNPGFDDKLRKHFKMACRKEKLMSVRTSSQLRCRYTDNNKNPLLLIAPLKEEEAFLNPRIVLYRKVLYDREIETIKRIAQPRVGFVFFCSQ